ncbi:MAG: ubiquinone/menaquinone biosynthesis C-methylase UbiE [Arenicella sp.]
MSEGIFSVLEESRQQSGYDGKVLAYDAIAGNRFYNKLFWGNWPSSYQKFCESGLKQSPKKPVLDVGCGSLVFTANAYAQSDNQQIVLLDRSLGMLKRARERLSKIHGSAPDNISFIQGDAFDLPFVDNAFGSVMSHGLLHIFDQKKDILSELERVKDCNGTISVTSLVSNGGVGRKYLSLLEKSGQTAKSLSSDSLNNLLNSRQLDYELCTQGNIAYIKSM